MFLDVPEIIPEEYQANYIQHAYSNARALMIKNTLVRWATHYPLLHLLQTNNIHDETFKKTYEFKASNYKFRNFVIHVDTIDDATLFTDALLQRGNLICTDGRHIKYETHQLRCNTTGFRFRMIGSDDDMLLNCLVYNMTLIK